MRFHRCLLLAPALVSIPVLASPNEPAFPALKVVTGKRPVSMDRALMGYPRSAVNLSPPCGQVLLALAISETGEVSDVRVVKSDPPDVFDIAAVKAVRGWRHAPEIEEGKPIPFQLLVPFGYKLEGTSCSFEKRKPEPAP